MNGKVIASQFRISKLLGQGGMDSVYLAEQIEMGRQVVVNAMNPAQMSSADLEERFRREAKAVAQLNHGGSEGAGGEHRPLHRPHL